MAAPDKVRRFLVEINGWGGPDRRGGRSVHGQGKVETLRAKLKRLAERGKQAGEVCLFALPARNGNGGGKVRLQIPGRQPGQRSEHGAVSSRSGPCIGFWHGTAENWCHGL